jgi:hypothetical protein
MSGIHPHLTWCARGHRCGLGEHRADPISAHVPGTGTVVLTRVQDTHGSDHAEINLRIDISPMEPVARRQLAFLLNNLRAVIARATTTTTASTFRRAG